MKKKNLKSLQLNKKSISKLDGKITGRGLGVDDSVDGPNDGSWWYCDTEGMGCRLDTRGPNRACTGTLVNSCACISQNNQYSCDCTVA